MDTADRLFCHSCHLPSSKQFFQTGPLVLPGKSNLFTYFANQQGEKIIERGFITDPKDFVESADM